jgi:hypothetical protein
MQFGLTPSPKLPSATSFIRKTLYDIPPLRRIRKYKNAGIFQIRIEAISALIFSHES